MSHLHPPGQRKPLGLVERPTPSAPQTWRRASEPARPPAPRPRPNANAHQVRNPLYLSHILMPMAYAVVYLLFSLLFYAATGDYIYKALDWSNPGGTGRLAGLILFLGIPILWILLYCLFLGRRCHRVSTTGRSSERLAEEVERRGGYSAAGATGSVGLKDQTRLVTLRFMSRKQRGLFVMSRV